ncbi:hypothetical protein BH20GEM1_BH20GEM1_14450 [soil metagenome]
MNEFLLGIRDRLREELDPQTLGAELAAFASTPPPEVLKFVAVTIAVVQGPRPSIRPRS